MRFLTKPVRNLLLATVFGTALVLVETEPVQATYPDCLALFTSCINNGGWPDTDPEAEECYFGYVVWSYFCTDQGTQQIIDGGLCFPFTPSGTQYYCDEG